MITPRVPVLVAAAGEEWEPAALEMLARSTRLAVHRRCVDLHDLVAGAGTGTARAALASAGLVGLDADSVATLCRHGVGLVVVADDPVPQSAERLRRLGVRAVVGRDLAGLVDALVAAEGGRTPAEATGPPAPLAEPDAGVDAGEDAPAVGRLVAVWGPAGAPGRTTVAVGLAAEAAHRGRRTLLVDADPYGGAVAQHLGVLEEVSGLLAAARLANAGELDPARLAGLARAVTEGLRVLTGLPRPDRWQEVRPGAFTDLLDAACSLDDLVVVDLGFSLERDPQDPFGSAPQRNQTTLMTLEQAHDVVVVGSADPVGLARLARGLVDLQEAASGVPLHVVVNRTRPTLGWSESQIRGMVEGFVRPSSVTFVPDDRPTADQALMAGRSLVELADSALRRGVGELADALVGPAGAGAGSRRSRRRRRGSRAQEPNRR